MRVRWIGLVCVLAGLAAVVGHQVGERTRSEPTTYAEARPVVAASPSLPIDSVAPYRPDIRYPTLERGLSYRLRQIGTPGYRWRYSAPRGWVTEPVGFQEIRWRPADEPEVGGYSLRVKIINAHQTNQDMVAQKRVAVEALYPDVEVTAFSSDMLSFTYRDPGTNRQRYNTFQWFTPTGGATAEFEMSVVGRAQDVPGLEDLQDHVADSVAKLP